MTAYRPDPGGIFTSDTHRRVAAQCMRPRSATEIADYFRKSDSNVAEDAHSFTGVTSVLAELEADGLVVNLGTFTSAEDALAAQDAHEEAIDFEGNPEVFANGASNPLGYPFLEREDHYVFTKLCHAKLTGPSETGEE